MEDYKSALIIKQPHIDRILKGVKTWEIRGSYTQKRGLIGLIQGGSGTIIGECELIDCIGPLTNKEYQETRNKHLSEKDVSGYKKTYAWVLSNPNKYNNPILYKHPKGAIIWVKV